MNYNAYRANLRRVQKGRSYYGFMSDEELIEEYCYGKNGHPKVLMRLLKYLEENNKLDIIR